MVMLKGKEYTGADLGTNFGHKRKTQAGADGVTRDQWENLFVDAVAEVGEHALEAASLRQQAIDAVAQIAPSVPIVTAARDQAVAAANTAAGIVQSVDVVDRAGIPPILDFPFSGPAAVPSGVITGSSGKWVTGQSGLLTYVPAGTAPIEYDPITSALRGLRVELATTNLILGSDAPSTQAVSVTAQAYTLSFYGTGTVTLSGAYAASVTGTGAFPALKTLTFTPAAGTLMLTISGAVQFAQFETGVLPTSYTRTVGSTVTRAADVNALLLSAVAGWSAAEGTVVIRGRTALGMGSTGQVLWCMDDGTGSNRFFIYRETNRIVYALTQVGGVTQSSLGLGSVADDAAICVSFSWAANSFVASLNGGTVVTASSGSIPSGVTTLRIGSLVGSSAPWNSTIARLTQFPRRLSNATHPLLTA
ncbi:hypothetical protein ABMY26_00320 (plasmid) [Azospirillum sp. HJ39]|uniref:hypothetical protein n=1 Tax=Azospirillum sp. HJ39 TaxID=3159496 RepID=UPI0035579276